MTNLAGKLIAIVDPFLAQNVKTGQYCWAVLYPRTVTSLRHHYTHPDVPELADVTAAMDEGRKAASRRWIDQYAAQFTRSYFDEEDEQTIDGELLIASATSYLHSGHHLCCGGMFEGEGTSDEFWDHYEVVTGKAVPERKRGNFFACSC